MSSDNRNLTADIKKSMLTRRLFKTILIKGFIEKSKLDEVRSNYKTLKAQLLEINEN